MKTKNPTKQTVRNIFLILSLAASAASGIYLHLAGKEFTNVQDGFISGSWMPLDMLFSTIIHVACSILAVIAVSIHLWHNRKWCKGLFRKNTLLKKRHQKGAIFLSALFMVVVFTGFASCANDYPNSVLGMIHAKLGLLMILCAIVHVYKRLQKNVTPSRLQGVPHINHSRCIGCGICVSGCPKGVFIIKDEVIRDSHISVSEKVRHGHKNRGKSYAVNIDACIRCGSCVRECPKHAINFNE